MSERFKQYKAKLRRKGTLRKMGSDFDEYGPDNPMGANPDFDPFASPFNDCSRCGQNMGTGSCGFDPKTQKAICLNCWRQDHPQGLPAHPGIGFDVPRADDNPLHNIVPNDERWSSCGPEGCSPVEGLPPEMDAAAGRLFAEAFRRAQTDGPDAAYKSMLASLQMWPGLRFSFEQAKAIADHWRQKYDSIFLGPEVNLGVPNDPRWSRSAAMDSYDADPYAHLCPQCGEPIDPESNECPSCGPELEPLTTGNTDAGEVHILPSERSANGRHQVMVIDTNGNSQWPTQYEPGRYGWDNPEAVTTPTHIIDRAYEFARALDRTRGTKDAPVPNAEPRPNEYGLIPFHAPRDVLPSLPEHPDPWMDNEPGTMTIPDHWGRRRLQ